MPNDTDTTDTPEGGIDLDPVIQKANNYAVGVFDNAETADPDQTALACAILGAACMPQPLGADDVGAVLSQGVTDLMTAFGSGKAKSTIGSFGN